MAIQQRRQRESRSNAAGAPDRLSADQVYSLLSNQRRRYVLYHLLETGETTLRDLSSLVAAWENGLDPAAVSHTQRKRVYTALHQNHLVRLEDNDIVEYERSGKAVSPTDRLSRLAPFLGVGATDEWDLSRYVGALGVGTGLVAAAMLLQLPVLSAGWGQVLMLVLAVLIVGLSVIQTRRKGQDGTVPTDLPGLTPPDRSSAADES